MWAIAQCSAWPPSKVAVRIESSNALHTAKVSVNEGCCCCALPLFLEPGLASPHSLSAAHHSPPLWPQVMASDGLAVSLRQWGLWAHGSQVLVFFASMVSCNKPSWLGTSAQETVTKGDVGWLSAFRERKHSSLLLCSNFRSGTSR